MRVLAFPRDDTNPYQSLLYGEMQCRGVRITYLGRLTPSHTLNLVLLPFELAGRRLAGARLVHLHWVFTFGFPGAQRFQLLRRVGQGWFNSWLRTTRLLGMHLVWTAHNVLPHERVFADDIRARRQLVRACDLVIAHSHSALSELATLGAVPRRSAVIPHGPIGPPVRVDPLHSLPGAGDGPRRFLFFGRVLPYKGVDDLLAAFAALPDHIPAHLTVTGQCDDPRQRAELGALARQARDRVTLRLGWVSNEDVAGLLAAADVVVLPFRRVTTSGSAMQALSHGRPLIVPDLPALADLPNQAIFRYDRSKPGLVAALTEMTRAPSKTLAAMSAAAQAYASMTTWSQIAERTIDEMMSVLGRVQLPHAHDQRQESSEEDPDAHRHDGAYSDVPLGNTQST